MTIHSVTGATIPVSNILLPMIRKLMPNLIAQQILDAQPQRGAAGRIFTSWNTRKYNIKYWPFQYVNTKYNSVDIEQWCWSKFKGRYWHSSRNTFVFKRAEDATMFKLKWDVKNESVE